MLMYDFYHICKCQKTKQIEQSFGRLEVKNYPQLGTQQHMTQQFSCLAQWNLNFERIKKNTIELNHFRSSPTPKIVLEPLYIYTHIYVKRYQYTATPSWPKTLLKHMCVTKQVIMPGPWPSIQTHHAHHHHDPCNVLFFEVYWCFCCLVPSSHICTCSQTHLDLNNSNLATHNRYTSSQKHVF